MACSSLWALNAILYKRAEYYLFKTHRRPLFCTFYFPAFLTHLIESCGPYQNSDAASSVLYVPHLPDVTADHDFGIPKVVFDESFPGGPIQNVDGWYIDMYRDGQYVLKEDEFLPMKEVDPFTDTQISPW